MSRKHSKKSTITIGQIIVTAIYGVICVMISLCTVFLAFQMHKSNEKMSDMEKKIEEQIAINNLQKEELAAVKLQMQKEDSQETEPQNVEMEGTISEETSSEPEPAPAEAVNYLQNLNDFSAETIIDSAQIDWTDLEKYFCSYNIAKNDAVYNRINGKSYKDNPNISLEELRYLKVLHYDFEKNIKVGELIVNYTIAEDVLWIFKELFKNEYGINSMRLIDDFWQGDPHQSDYQSIDVNNTSAFCYRTATGSGNMSYHAYGKAIDINPQQNPYVTYDGNGQPSYSHSNAQAYIDRSSNVPYVITHDDLCYKLFTEKGFTWGGDWSNPKDYQHFEKQ